MHEAMHEARRRWKLREHQAPARDEDLPAMNGLPVERTYCQSTSGLKSSQRTNPPDSRSIATTKSPPMRCATETALYRYDTEVEHRSAKDWRSAGLRERKYVSNLSISGTLPEGKLKAIPAAHLLIGKMRYSADMSAKDAQESKLQQRMYELRRRRLRALIEDHGSMTEFATAVGDSLSYLSRLVQVSAKGRKNLGEPKARRYEVKLGLDVGWFDKDENGKAIAVPATEPTYWPFPFTRKRWEHLPAAEKRRIAGIAFDLIRAYEAQEQQKDTG